MKIIKCSFSATFPVGITGKFEKIYLEADLDETDDVRKSLYSLKKQASDFFYESNKALEKQVNENNVTVKAATLPEQISTCTSLKVLETYKFIVKNNEELQSVYDNKYLELSEKN